MALFEVAKKVEKADIVFKGVSFNRFKLSDKEKFMDYLLEMDYKNVVWENNFPTLYLLANNPEKFNTYCWLEIEDCIYVFIYNDSVKRITSFCPPLYKDYDDYMKSIPKALNIMAEVNGRKYTMLDNLPLNSVGTIFEKVDKTIVIPSDFIFRNEELINLQGKKYKSRRNVVNQFKKTYPNHVIRDYVPSDFDDVTRIREKFMKERIDDKDAIAWDNTIIFKFFDFCEELDLSIKVIEIDGNVEGYLTMTPLCKDCSVIINENTNLDFKGATELLWYTSLSENIDMGSFSNDGNGGKPTDNNNDNGIYKYKMSHNPHYMVDKCAIKVNKQGKEIDLKVVLK